jgi:Flp pilus assembly protein TadB
MSEEKRGGEMIEFFDGLIELFLWVILILCFANFLGSIENDWVFFVILVLGIYGLIYYITHKTERRLKK